MAEKRVLVDTNSYVRLARDIHPLLGQSFTVDEWTLYIIEEFESEYSKQPRLQNKHSWVTQNDFKVNRAFKLKPNSFEKGAIENARIFIGETAKELELTASPVDVRALATAHVLKIPVITDDDDMIQLADEYEIEVWKSLKFLSVLLAGGVIALPKIRSMYQYWCYLPDKPKNCAADYKALFNEDPPPPV
ncbi:hypothetical protein AZI86_05260 [Bdellovibrio bacteriovorus]|uniref:PIN domain-containing protein n=1 Tax=Bdellovibrio bacteriovorus TaxID=959 RepID=A0A150WQH5_BDEBC|nr:hypothetical protein [Bdellovibrio bacteriovorus]KYG66455.1 hypothetical protein AZI86_05260 [Bdellovibrio bacteriovorus]